MVDLDLIVCVEFSIVTILSYFDNYKRYLQSQFRATLRLRLEILI